MTNRFIALDMAKSRSDATIEYTHVHGLIPRLMASLFPGMFRRQTQKWLDQFKTFAEAPSI